MDSSFGLSLIVLIPLVVIISLLLGALLLKAAVWIFNRLTRGASTITYAETTPAPAIIEPPMIAPPELPMVSSSNPFAAPLAAESAAPVIRPTGGVPMPSLLRAIGICFVAALLSFIASMVLSCLVSVPIVRSPRASSGVTIPFGPAWGLQLAGQFVISFLLGVVVRRGLLPTRWGPAFAIHGIEYAIIILLYMAILAAAVVIGLLSSGW